MNGVRKIAFFFLLSLLHLPYNAKAFFSEKININPTHNEEIKKLFLKIEDNIYKDLDIVISSGNKIIAMAQEDYSIDHLFNAYSKIGLSYEHRNKLNDALRYYKHALEYAKELGDKSKIIQSYLYLSVLYRRDAQYGKSSINYKKAMYLAAELQDTNLTKQITELQCKYHTESHENKLTLLQNEQERTQSMAILLGLLFLALISAAFAVILRKNNLKLLLKNAEIEQKNVKLKASNQVLQQFAYIAAHDLKEPLRSIGSFSNLIQRRYGHELNDEAKEYMSYIRTSAIRMDSLLRSLLEYSGITMQPSEYEVVNTKEVLQEVLQNLREITTASNAKIEAANLLNVSMKKMHLIQLLQNIIANSIKYNENKPYIQISTHQSDGRVYFTLQDNGIGIDEANGDKIFKLFYQEDKDKEGSGVGLAICKNIIEKYGGNIHYDSKMNSGTTFFFDLPIG